MLRLILVAVLCGAGFPYPHWSGYGIKPGKESPGGLTKSATDNPMGLRFSPRDRIHGLTSSPVQNTKNKDGPSLNIPSVVVHYVVDVCVAVTPLNLPECPQEPLTPTSARAWCLCKTF